MNIDKLLKIAEDEGWKVFTDFNGGQFPLHIEFENTTPQHQDLVVYVNIENDSCDEVLKEIKNYYDGFDISYESILWTGKDGHGKNGAPDYLGNIVRDMEDAKRMIGDLYEAMQDKPYHNRNDKDAFKKFFMKAKEESISDVEFTPDTIRFLKNYWLNDNYFGENKAYILFGKKRIDIESVWHDNINAYVHVSCTDFETDIKVTDLSDRNIKKVFDMLYSRYINNLKEKMYE